MKNKKTIIITTIALLAVAALIVFYMFGWYFKLNEPVRMAVFNKIVSSKIPKVLAMVISAVLISVVSLVFQTITQNRILTPGMIGFDGVFVTTQILLLAILGAASFLVSNVYLNFIISTIVMMAVALALYKMILRKNKNNIMLLLLAGIIITELLSSFNYFLEATMNPEEFTSITSKTMVSVNNMNTTLVYFVLPVMAVMLILFFRERRVYDVMSLGEDMSISLGVHYTKAVNRNMVYISISMAIATALIGPISFLGLISVNAARELLKTYKHSKMLALSSLIGIIALIGGQIIVEELMFSVTLPIVINLAGGIYVIYLVLKQNKI